MNASQLAALKAELLGDPQALGYAPLLAVGNHSGLAELLNDTARGGTLQLTSAPADVLRCSITPGDYASLSAADRTFLGFLLGGTDVYLTGTVRVWVNQLANFATSKAAMAAHFSRPQSRAEALLGEGVAVNHGDVGGALQLP